MADLHTQALPVLPLPTGVVDDHGARRPLEAGAAEHGRGRKRGDGEDGAQTAEAGNGQRKNLTAGRNRRRPALVAAPGEAVP